jgi:hypothetical protein
MLYLSATRQQQSVIIETEIKNLHINNKVVHESGRKRLHFSNNNSFIQFIYLRA